VVAWAGEDAEEAVRTAYREQRADVRERLLSPDVGHLYFR
jgi:hypothetical protein